MDENDQPSWVTMEQPCFLWLKSSQLLASTCISFFDCQIAQDCTSTQAGALCTDLCVCVCVLRVKTGNKLCGALDKWYMVGVAFH